MEEVSAQKEWLQCCDIASPGVNDTLQARWYSDLAANILYLHTHTHTNNTQRTTSINSSAEPYDTTMFLYDYVTKEQLAGFDKYKVINIDR